MIPNVLTNTFKVPIHFNICVSQHIETLCTKKRIPFGVVFHSGVFIMLRAVEFNDEIRHGAIKINNIIPNHILPMYFAR